MFQCSGVVKTAVLNLEGLWSAMDVLTTEYCLLIEVKVTSAFSFGYVHFRLGHAPTLYISL